MDLMLERVALLQDGKVVRFERHLKHSPEDVWAALTDPAKVATWFAQMEGDVVEKGKISFRFNSTSGTVVYATITHLEKPTLFEYAWERQQEPATVADLNRLADDGGGHCGRILDLTGNLIRFVVGSVPGGGSTLALQHSIVEQTQERIEADARAARPAAHEQPELLLASWHNHLDALGSFLSQSKSRAVTGTPQKMEWQWDRFHQLKDKYAQAIR